MTCTLRRNSLEERVAGIWRDALKLDQVGVHDNFFDLGGDSLSGAIIAAQLDAAFGVELSLGAIADHPTVSTLAAFIDERRRAGTTKTLPPVVRVPRASSMPMSLFQEFDLASLPAPRSQLHVLAQLSCDRPAQY